MEVQQEDDLLAGRAISVVGAVLVAIVIGTGFSVAGMLARHERELRPSGVFPEARLPRPTERSAIEQHSFAGESQAMRQRAREQAVLDSYGWVDRERGIVRIPIERAIELYVAEEGRR